MSEPSCPVGNVGHNSSIIMYALLLHACTRDFLCYLYMMRVIDPSNRR